MTLKVGSVFSGLGGADKGCEDAGMTVGWQIENDPSCIKVLETHWPDVRRYGDVKEVNPRELEAVDLFIGGFPCQDLSVAGRRAGLAGERSGLWYEFHRILAGALPQWLIVENVPGLLSSQRGRDLAAILRGLVQLGYGVAWRVLDAQAFYVPQKRQRPFIVGSLGDGRAAEVLFEPESLQRYPQESRKKGPETAYAPMASVRGSGDGHGNGWNRNYVSYALTARGSGERLEAEGNYIVHALTSEGHDASEDGTGRGVPLIAQCHGGNVGPMGALRRGNGSMMGGIPFLAQTVTASHANPTGQNDGMPPNILAFDWQAAGSERTFSHRKNGKAQISASKTEAVLLSTMAVRRLTPLEVERVMGLPDGWTDIGLSDAARYRICGNAMVPAVVEWVVRRILEVEGK